MIKTYSQRLLPPYYGQVQIAQSERARALTADGQTWEIQFLHLGNDTLGVKHSYRRAVTISNHLIQQKKIRSLLDEKETVDARILELTDFLADISLPFPAADCYEYWLLDNQDQSPLALIFSCCNAEQMDAYPARPEWTALPAAVMPIDKTDDEASSASAPVNYRLERLVAERAGWNPKAKWFTRNYTHDESFPSLMIREDWQDEEATELCQRYLYRQSSRLLMLHNLSPSLRGQLEINARTHALEVDRFYQLYPEISDSHLMDAIRVEAKLRKATEEHKPEIHERRDGIHYF